MKSFLTMRRLGVILPAAAPSVVVLGLFLFARDESGPASRPAITPVEMHTQFASLSVAARPHAAPDVVARAARREAELTKGFAMASPFFAVARQSEPRTTTSPTNAPPPTLDVRLTSLMDTPRGAIAVIDGRPCRAGDRIGDAATIDSIDVEARTVNATLDTGETVSLVLEAPGLPSTR